MIWETRWKILADLITDLRRSGVAIPPNIINDLRSAKTMMEILKVDRSHPENLSRLEQYLNNIEIYVLPIAKDRFGEKYVNEKLKELCEFEREKFELEAETQIRFHPELPKEEKWIRIKTSEEIPLEDIKRICEENLLKYRIQEDGFVLVYGDEEGIKAFVKRIAETIHGLRKNLPRADLEE